MMFVSPSVAKAAMNRVSFNNHGDPVIRRGIAPEVKGAVLRWSTTTGERK